MPYETTKALLTTSHAWLSESGFTPYVIFAARYDGVRIPTHLEQSMPLVLNLSSTAVKNLTFLDEAISFSARFSGEVFEVYIPYDAIFSLVSRETGCGVNLRSAEMVASDETGGDTAHSTSSSHLKLT